MKQALYDSNGVLKSHGFVFFAPAAGETVKEVPDDFNFPPGLWRLVNNDLLPFTPPKSQREIARENALAKINAATADNGIPVKVREALSAIKELL